MKNTLILLLILAMLGSLTGCQLPSFDTDVLSTLPEQLEQLLPQKDEISQTPLYSVSLPMVSQTIHADDGQELFRYTYQNISLTIPDPEVADRIIVDLLNRIDATAQDAKQLKSAAKNAYGSSNPWTPYLCSILYTPGRLDSAVFSLYSAYSTYSGNPHPETAYASITYDMLTGNVLSLQDILTADTTAASLSALVIEQLQENGDSQFYTGYETTVTDRFDDLSDKGWYLSNAGLCFYFSPYEIASYAAGKIIAEIPYSKLTGILKDEYFPSELQSPTGEISQRIFDTEAASAYSQIAEVVIQEGSSKKLLHTDGIVYHITIESGTLENDQFTPESTVFMAQSLTMSDAIMIEAELSGQEHFKISYTGKDGDSTIYLP